jgi:hypothetical protein
VSPWYRYLSKLALIAERVDLKKKGLAPERLGVSWSHSGLRRLAELRSRASHSYDPNSSSSRFGAFIIA